MGDNTYDKTMADGYGDEFYIKSEYGQVSLTDKSGADLYFTPDEALKLARHLTKAAAAAYEQERDASR